MSEAVPMEVVWGGGRRRRTRRKKEQAAEEDEGGGGGEEENPAEAHLLAEDVRWRRGHGARVGKRNVEAKKRGVKFGRSEN